MHDVAPEPVARTGCCVETSRLTSSSSTMRPLLEVDEEELARLQAAEALHVAGLDVEHAGLGAEHDPAVLRLHPAAGAQAVAVERRADDAAVRERDRRGAVPRLHQARVEGVEALELVGEVVAALVGLGDHHHHRVRQRPAGEHEQLEDVVERRRVRAARAHDRHDLLQVAAEQLATRARDSRARIQLTLPISVLISPLWQITR